ncbi:MAG TPA: hypothetical protein VF450_08115 [Noviherbaspirillum sp.]
MNFQYRVFGIIAAYFQPCNAPKGSEENNGICARHLRREEGHSYRIAYQSAVTITDASNRTFHGVVRTYKPAHSAAEAFDSSAVKNSRF